MRTYEEVMLPMFNTTAYIFPGWVVAAWVASHAARRKTRAGLKLTAWFGLLSMLALVVLNAWLLWVMAPIFQRGPGMLQSNYRVSLLLLLLPLVLSWIWGAPEFLKAIRAPRSGGDAVDATLQANFTSSRFAMPFQLGLSGAFAAYFVLMLPPAIPLEMFFVLGWLAYGAWRWRRQDELQRLVSQRGIEAIPRFWPRLARRSGLVFGFVAVIGCMLGLKWWNSNLPREYSMNMHSAASMQIPPGTSMRKITDIRGPQDGTPDRRFTLVAQKAMVKLGSGDTIEALTYNGQVPGPELRVRQGELVEVTLQNRDIADGVTIHWHGINVPNAEDGVAGLTQDAVMPGETYIYRFRAVDSGSYWYHSHQHSFEQVARGLFGTIIVEPSSTPARTVDPAVTEADADIVVPIHVWQIPGSPERNVATVGNSTAIRRTILPGTRVRLRLINTDSERSELNLTGSPFRVTAIDGVDLNEPEPIERARLLLAAGGRYDLQFTMPRSAVRLSTFRLFLGNNPIDSPRAEVVLAPDETIDIADAPSIQDFNPASYGKSVEGTVNLRSHFDREYKYTFESGLGFHGRAFNVVYLINGKEFPNAAPLMVREGEWIKITFVNRWFEAHPIHPHGHRMLVLSRNGEPVRGTPWWTDTLNVDPGETYEVALKADNPGIWMDHCHNLFHASMGMVMHLMYDNVTTPFVAGVATRNNPE